MLIVKLVEPLGIENINDPSVICIGINLLFNLRIKSYKMTIMHAKVHLI